MSSRLHMCLYALVFLPLNAVAEEAPAEKSIEQLAFEVESSGLGPDCAGNRMKLSAMAARPDFQNLHPRRQALLLITLAMCTADAGSFDAALDYAGRAAALDPDSASAHGVRMMLGMSAGRPLESVESLEALSRLRPDHIRMLDAYRIGQLVDAAWRADPSGAAALRAFDALLRANWRPSVMDFDEPLRVTYAQLLIDRGKPDEARRLVASIADVQQVVAMRADRRFDALRKDREFDASLELKPALERQLAKSKAAMEAEPRLMRVAYDYLAALTMANRYQEALDLANGVIARHAADAAAYSDADEMLALVRGVVGMSLYELGQLEDGRRYYREFVGGLGGDWLQGTMQMAQANFLVGEGRGQEALEVLAQATELSSYGKAWAEAIKVCAARQVEDATVTAESLAYVLTHEFDNDRALPHALLCVDDIDALARTVVERLENPATRAEILGALQVGPETAFDRQAHRKAMSKREARLRGRKDVRGAVAAVGRIEDIPVRVSGLY